MSTNASKILPPPPFRGSGSPQYQTHANAMMLVYFRRSADGVTFDISPTYVPPAEGMQAVGRFGHEYSLDGTTWKPWPGGYNNSAQQVGGRGRLSGASLPAD